MTARPWPYGPLAEAIGGSLKHQGQVLGVHERQLYRWRAYGLTDDQADTLAIRIGSHPALIWPTWDDGLLVDVEQLDLDLGDVA